MSDPTTRRKPADAAAIAAGDELMVETTTRRARADSGTAAPTPAAPAETPKPTRATIDPEVKAMDSIAKILGPLDGPARGRVMDWMRARFAPCFAESATRFIVGDTRPDPDYPNAGP